MARGYPDYFGFSSFPTRGIYAERKYGPALIAGGGFTNVHAIIAKGSVTGGFIYGIGSIDWPNLKFLFKVDSDAPVTFSLADLLAWRVFSPDSMCVFFARMDSDTTEFSLGISTKIDFGLQLQIQFYNFAAAGVTITSIVDWYKVI
jgi:hypothetical protein